MLSIPAQFSFSLSGVHKGLGLQLLCEHLNIQINETVAFGDGENDREFLSAAGVGCAMKNARPAAKEAADIIIQVIILVLYYSSSQLYRSNLQHSTVRVVQEP